MRPVDSHKEKQGRQSVVWNEGHSDFNGDIAVVVDFADGEQRFVHITSRHRNRAARNRGSRICGEQSLR